MTVSPPPLSSRGITAERVRALRALTPGAASTTHFNHASASLPSRGTLDAITAQLQREAAIGPMEASAAAQDSSERARTLAARLLNAEPAEIALITGNSAGWGAAFAALGPWRRGDRILVGRHEWGGNLAAMRLVSERHGVSVETIASDASGAVDPDALASMLDKRVRLVALTWLPANGGLINPAAAIGRVTRRHGVPYFIDAAQALGQIPIDVRALGCDVLAGVGRKALRAPRGTALLYVREAFAEQLVPVVVDTHSAALGEDGRPVLRAGARRFEFSEQSIALRCGLANALHEALELGIDNIRACIDANARTVRARLAAITGVTVLDQGAERSGLVSFAVTGWHPGAVQQQLAQQGISISANGMAFTPLDLAARGLHGVARASVSYLTTDEEIGALASALQDLASRRPA